MMTKAKQKMIILLSICMIFALSFSTYSVEAANTTSTIYVLTQYSSEDGDGVSYKYNNNGLLTKKKNMLTGFSTSYTYNGKLVTKQVQKYSSDYKDVWTYSYDDKNRLTEIDCKSSDNYQTTSKYSYDKQNRISKCVYEESGSEALSGASTFTYTYNKSNEVTKEVIKGPVPSKSTWSYDKNGITKKYKSNYSLYKMKADYENGRLSELTMNNKTESTSNTYVFKYKKITIPKEYVSTVKAQQAALLKQACYAPQFVFAQ